MVELLREDGRPTATLHVAASVPLVCQRCMGRVDVPVVAESRVVLVAVPAEADKLPAGMESFFAEGGRVALRDLVEEELMLALPLVPRHESSRDCHTQRELQDAVLPASGQDIESSLDATQTPFSGLGDLLKRRT